MKYFNETYIKRKFLTRNEWADTYKAIHSTTEEKVILKVLVRKSNDEDYINNLFKEVQILKNIKSPNLININNMFKYIAGTKVYYYIEGEYFKGISLKEKLITEKLEEKQAVETFLKIAKGLKEFHNRKVLYNNLSLNNIIVNSKGDVKIDILSHLENKDFISNEEEQNMEQKEFNPQKDIYDLGIILYNLLTGKLDFDISNYKNEISNKNLISIIDKATNNYVEDKYKSVNRLVLDINSYLQCGQLSYETYEEEKEENFNTKKRKKGKVVKKLGTCAAIIIVGGSLIYCYDLIKKNNTDNQSNIIKVEEDLKSQEEVEKVDKEKEDKIDVDENKEENNNQDNYSSNNSNKNDSSSNNVNTNNNSTNNSSGNNSNNNTNKPNKPSKPSGNTGSGNTPNKPVEDDNKEEETPEVIPPSNDSNNDSNSSNEDTTTDSPNIEVEGK